MFPWVNVRGGIATRYFLSTIIVHNLMLYVVVTKFSSMKSTDDCSIIIGGNQDYFFTTHSTCLKNLFWSWITENWQFLDLISNLLLRRTHLGFQGHHKTMKTKDCCIICSYPIFDQNNIHFYHNLIVCETTKKKSSFKTFNT